MPHTNSDKIKIIDVPYALPGKCILCLAPADGRKFLDIGMDIEFYGQVLFCEHCITPVAESLDYVPGEQHAKLANVLAIALDENEALKKENERIRNLLDGLLGYTSVGSVVPIDKSVPTDGQLELAPEPTSTATSEQGTTEQRTPEPAPSKRSKDLPDSTDSDRSALGGIEL